MGVFNELRIKRIAYLCPAYSLSLQEDINTILKNNNITDDDISEFIDIITYGGIAKSLFIKQENIICKSLIVIFKNKQAEKKQINKLFNLMNKMIPDYIFCKKHNKKFEWVTNVIQNGFVLSLDQKITLLKLNFYDILNEDIITDVEINVIFTKPYYVDMVLKNKDKFKEILIKNCITLKHENLVSSVQKISYLNATIDDILLFFDFNNYEFTNDDLFKILFESNLSGFMNIILFFKNKNILPNFTTLLNLLRLEVKSLTNGKHLSALISFMDDNNILNNIINSENNILLLLRSYGNKCNLTITKCMINIISKCNITENIIKTIIMIDQSELINIMIKNKLLGLIDENFGFKYACVNGNYNLIEYYLNNKMIPNIQHLYYVMLSSHNNIENIKNIILLLLNYGLAIDNDFYEIVSTNKQLLKEYPNNHKMSKLLCMEPVHYDIESSQYKYKMPKYKLDNNIEELKELCLKSDLHNILIHIDKHDIVPNQECFENSLMNDNSNVFEYMHDYHSYIPDILNIVTLRRFVKRFIMIKRFVKIDKN